MENQSSNDLSTVIDGLFANSVTTFTTSNGTLVEFKRAGIVQLGKATKFFNLIMERAPADKIKALLDLIIGEQQKMIDEGKTVYDLNLNAVSLIEKGLNNTSLLLGCFAGMADALPEFVTLFSNISEEEYEVMELDEQIVIAVGVFAVNYGFFTQSLPPIIKSVMQGLQQKQNVTPKNEGKRHVVKEIPAKKPR